MNTVSNDFSISVSSQTTGCVHTVYCKRKIQMTFTVAKVNCLGRQPDEKQSFSGNIFGNGNL